MNKNWEKIFTSKSAISAEIVRGMLEENDIQAVLLNKQDSATMAFGAVELYVHKEQVIKALRLLEQRDYE